MAEFPPSQIFKELLTAHVAISLWTIEIGIMPDSPDTVIMITDTGGVAPNPKFLLDFPTTQVMVRGSTSGYLAAWREAKAVKDIMLGITSQNVTWTDRLVSVVLTADMSFVGRDDTKRPLFSMNFQLIVEPQSVANSNRISL
jgi:hypothetical protein